MLSWIKSLFARKPEQLYVIEGEFVSIGNISADELPEAEGWFLMTERLNPDLNMSHRVRPQEPGEFGS